MKETIDIKRPYQIKNQLIDNKIHNHMSYFECNKFVTATMEQKAIYDKYKRCAFKVDIRIKRNKSEEVDHFKALMRKKTMEGMSRP